MSVSGNNTEQAMEWLLAHIDDDVQGVLASAATTGSTGQTKTGESLSTEGGESSSAEVVAPQEAKSIKCEDCGRLFKTSMEVEFHAAKSGHSNFAESTEEKKPLTEEEKKAQLKLVEEKIAKKRVEREEREKQETSERERLRIKSGKDMTEVRRKMEEDEMKKIVSFNNISDVSKLNMHVSSRSSNVSAKKQKKRRHETGFVHKSNVTKLPVAPKPDNLQFQSQLHHRHQQHQLSHRRQKTTSRLASKYVFRTEQR